MGDTVRYLSSFLEFVLKMGGEKSSSVISEPKQPLHVNAAGVGAADWEVPEGRAAQSRRLLVPLGAGRQGLLPSPSHLQARFRWWCQDLGARPAGAELRSGFWCTEAARQLRVSPVSLQ